MKKHKKTLISIILAMLSIIIIAVIILLPNKMTFTTFDDQTKTVILMLLKNKNAVLKSNNYCSYNDQKYSKGSLSCTIEESLITDKSNIDMRPLKHNINDVGWNYVGDNIDTWNHSGDQYDSASIYESKGNRCFVRVKVVELNIREAFVGCSGPAKHEWYPVRKD